MTQQNSNLDELLAVVERIRVQVSPDIPSDVFRNILMVEFENQDDRSEALNRFRRIVNEYLNTLDEKRGNTDASL